ncbi:alpha/beta hydrolase family protein [Candidatus Uabimicrobium amorphum]|uniref:AB hydrolase-1 domain-containing protein n=1 Tax=Uabimicrobium amorphum TaxID=2596890 RepID=A0A5S9IMA6_UABAM|nr:alpha/beta hydrolase [Candidatus Uabimicrobium amorphum]BBM84523.1 hypothetical protein UABAM_02884 [Candidatus Uabimicrobium amorphum]
MCRIICILSFIGLGFSTVSSQQIKEEQVVFFHGNVRLAGTLVLPKSPGPHPAIVVVHGSGASDRSNWEDQTRHFPQHGIALLKFDKRGVGDSSGDWRLATMANLADDVISGVKFLQRRTDIRSNKIGVWGGSQGWTVASLAAARSKGSIAFAVVISGDPKGLWEQEKYRIRVALAQDKVAKETSTRVEHLMNLMQTYFATGKNYGALKECAQSPQYKKHLHYVVRGGVIPPENHPLVTYWKLNFSYKPLSIIPQIHCPILSLWGDKDSLVNAHDAEEVAGKAFRESNHANYTSKVISNADHGLYYRKQSGIGWAKDRSKFAPGAMEYMTSWVLNEINKE